MTVHLGAKHQITLPKGIVKQARLALGDPLEVAYEEDSIILRPQIHIPRDQAYFWTRQWQVGEREAEEDIKAGRVYGPFRSAKEMKRFFNKAKR